MAKWGEGDPRWIVEERADATNVNNWHWTEKNATPWSKEKLKELLEGLKIEEDGYKCEITELTKTEGEASASNRKAKLIFFYEWEIKADWKGSKGNFGEIIKGKLDIVGLSEENDADEVTINVSTDSTKKTAGDVKEFMRKKGASIIQQKLQMYINELQTEFSQGMILPTKEKSTGKANGEPVVSEVKKTFGQCKVDKQQSGLGVQIECKTLKQKEEFKCEAAQLYDALTRQEMVSAFTRDNAQVEAEKGGQFRLLGGNITGDFVDLVRDKKIVMRWRHKSWPQEHFSTVTITLDQEEDCTKLTLVQKEVPKSVFDSTEQNWRLYFWESIRQTFGFGARLF